MDDVTEFRRSLTRTARRYTETAHELYSPAPGNSQAEADAHRGLTMGGLYAYALAAAVKLVQDAHGDDAALTLATELEDLMTNGDDGELNEDLFKVRTANTEA